MSAHKSSPFAQAVVASMRKLQVITDDLISLLINDSRYPEALADKSFDNTGLLLEAPSDHRHDLKNSVLLTVDLTRAVADEAIARQDSIVIAYHPIIFRGLKSLTLGDSQQTSLLRLAAAGISVYSPHTAVDSTPGGLSDWLADIVVGVAADPQLSLQDGEQLDGSFPSSNSVPSPATQNVSSKSQQSPALDGKHTRPHILQRQYSKPSYPHTNTSATQSNLSLHRAQTAHSRTTLQPVAAELNGYEGAGFGRLVSFDQPQPLAQLIERIAQGMGTPAGFPVAVPQGKAVDEIEIRSVAVCAGSGSSVFQGVEADLFFTGEMSHHEALALTERGACVITLFHSNSERGFLRAVMKPRLESRLKEELQNKQLGRNPESGDEIQSPHQTETLAGNEAFEVECSEQDRDPFGIVILQQGDRQGAASNLSGEA